MACDPTQECPICDQRGLPIFPLRYAVARAEGVTRSARAPVLEAPFAVGAVALPEQLAHYTLRLVRQGYIYVFNEARDEWSGYIVTESAHLLPFDVNLPAPPAAESAAPCSRMAQSQSGRCIMIPDAQDASLLGKVWLAFTPSAWTQETLRKHRSESHRRKHMRCFDAAAWVGGNGSATQPHAAPFVEARDGVAELAATAPFTLGALPGPVRTGLGFMASPALGYSMTRPVVLDPPDVAMLEASIRQAAQVQVPRVADSLPVAISLDDPAGIGADLNLLIQGLATEWLSEPERSEKLETASTIDAIKKAIENGAAEEARQGRRDRAVTQDGVSRMLFGTAYRTLAGPRDADLMERIERAAELSDEEKAEAGRRRWRKYNEMLKGASASQRAEWETYLEEVFPAELADFSARVLNPLDEAYVAWLSAPAMRNYFRLNFDPDHFTNGLDYANAFLMLIQESTGRLKVFDYLTNELTADPLDEDAFVVRALMGNHNPAIGLWASDADVPVPTGSEPDWAAAGASLLGAYTALVTSASSGPLEGPLNNLGRVAMQLSGPILKLLGDGWDRVVASGIRRLPEHRILSLLTMLGHTDASPKRVVPIRAQLTRKQAARTLSGMLAHYSGEQSQVFRSGARIAYDRLPMHGDQRFDIKGFVLIDERSARALDHRRGMGLSRSGHLQAVGQAMRPEAFDEAMRRAGRELLNAEFRGHLLGGMLVSLTLSSALKEMQRVGIGANTATANFASGVAALTGSMFESAGALARRTAWGATSLGRPIALGLVRLDTRAAVVGFAGRVVGFVAGVVGGVLAISDGYRSLETSRSYGVSMMVLGFLGAIAGALVLFASSAVATVALIIGIVIACLMVLVGFVKPDEIQVWLSKARYFGKSVTESREFESQSVQRSALEQLSTAGAN